MIYRKSLSIDTPGKREYNQRYSVRRWQTQRMAEYPVQRRLSAILAADVVGYSRLIGEDEAGTLARLKGRRKEGLAPLVAKRHGRVFKIPGDGGLVGLS